MDSQCIPGGFIGSYKVGRVSAADEDSGSY